MKNNMYDWIDKTRNFIAGECPHKCHYCYVKSIRFPLIKEKYSGQLRLIESELDVNEGKGKTVFVQDMGDMFADGTPSEWIRRILEHLNKYPENTYLFQTKNPERFIAFFDKLPQGAILGTTIETNIKYIDSNAPTAAIRQYWMSEIGKRIECRRMVSIEPIMDFDLDIMTNWIREINPEFVSIGADSKNSGLREPDRDKVNKLIAELKKFTEVKIKGNMDRILKSGEQNEMQARLDKKRVD